MNYPAVKRIILYLCLNMVIQLSYADSDARGPLEHGPFNSLLGKYVSDGRIDYLSWKRNDFTAFEDYIKGLQDISLQGLNRNERKAFWINTYNALTIYGVLKHIPDNNILARAFSVQFVAGFFDRITYNIAAETLTLNDIENEKLRTVFKDPRIHFALVCASSSCPKIRNKIFKANTLDDELDKAARVFIRDTSRNRLDRKRQVLFLSEIFKWYSGDFIDNSGSVIEYVKKYMTSSDVAYLNSHNVEIRYLLYNWLANIGNRQIKERGWVEKAKMWLYRIFNKFKLFWSRFGGKK